jgi:hypothetical protein
MDPKSIFYVTLHVAGLMGLMSLRNMSVQENFQRFGPVVGVGTFVQHVFKFAILIFFIFEIVNGRWYSPLINLGIGFIAGGILSFFTMGFKAPTEVSRVSILLSIILTVGSTVFLFMHYLE